MDLGTTKVAGYLVDFSTGQTLAAKGVTNPQVSYGEDIISRISYAMKSLNKGSRLQKLAVEAINELSADLCAEVSANTEEIVEAVVVGNTAMHHLFLGLPVRQLALSPYVPAVSRALDIKARNLGLHIAPGAYLHLLPNIAGFVGASKQWGCPVFGSAVFFNRPIPERWPSGVYWNQGSKSTKTWRYDNNPVKKSRSLSHSIPEGMVLIRIYSLIDCLGV